jgi:hypothetical protein
LTASPGTTLKVSRQTDLAEVEATRLADSFNTFNTESSSRSLAMRKNIGNRKIVNRVVPHYQRDLTGKKTVKDGDFDLNLKTESHPGAKNGMSGTIKFTASNKAPDSKNIRLLQIVRDEDLSTGKDYVWTGGESNRNKVMTEESPGITAGFHVDQSYGLIKPRTAKADAAISPYYIDYANSGAADNYDGSKVGAVVKDASLWDYPGSGGNRRFTFETAAKATDTGYVYATLKWGFTISDAAKGTVEKEHATAHRSPSWTFAAANEAFKEFYKNPGSSGAPK